MSAQSPVSDMVASIKNSLLRSHKSLTVPYSNLKHSILLLLVREGYLRKVSVQEGNGSSTKRLEIYLKYGQDMVPAIHEISMVSKPSCRVYVDANNLPYVRDGLGIAVLSTNQGILTPRQAKVKNIGGEFICSVF